MKLMIWRIWTVAMVLILSPNIIGVTEGRQCYVCGVDSDAVFRLNGYLVNDDGELYFQNPSAATTTPSPSRPVQLRYNLPPSCLEFDGSDSLHEFVRECPDGYEGCLTQIDGTNGVIRTCDTLALNDCKIANKVNYCYCNGDLCNSRPASSFGIDDQSNYDASATEDDDDGDENRDADDDYGDEFSGMRPTAPFPGGIKSDRFDVAPGSSTGRGRSTPGSWSTAVQQQGINGNSHTPFHQPATIGPTDTSSTPGQGPLAQSGGRLLIAFALFIIRNRLLLTDAA